MMIFDGVLVDDIILFVNLGNYLEWYFCYVIEDIEMCLLVELIVIGIGYDVICYYCWVVIIVDVEELVGVMIDQFVDFFDDEVEQELQYCGCWCRVVC